MLESHIEIAAAFILKKRLSELCIKHILCILEALYGMSRLHMLRRN